MDLSYIQVSGHMYVLPHVTPEREREVGKKRKSPKQSKTQTISRITRMNHQNYQSCSSGGNLANSAGSSSPHRYTAQIQDMRYKIRDTGAH